MRNLIKNKPNNNALVSHRSSISINKLDLKCCLTCLLGLKHFYYLKLQHKMQNYKTLISHYQTSQKQSIASKSKYSSIMASLINSHSAT